jgi:O-antigen ligase
MMISATSTVHRPWPLLLSVWLLVACVLSLWLASNPLLAFAAGLTWLLFSGLTFTQWFNRAVFVLFFAELILGGRGRAVEIHETLPIRLAIGVFLVLAFFSAWFADGRTTRFELGKARACLIATAMGVGTFLFFGLLLGRAYSNDMDYILGDGRGFLFLVGAIPLLFFATRRKANLSFVVGCFSSIVCFFGAAKSFGYALILTQLMSVKQMRDQLDQYIPQEVGAYNLSKYIAAPRFYLAGDFFLMFALPVLVSLALSTKIRRTRVLLYGATGVLVVGLISSETRGLWMAALLTVAVVFWLSNVRSRLKIAVILPFILVAVLALSEDFLPSVRERFGESFNVEDSSYRGRIDQFAPLMDMATKHIILGNGFGSYAHDHPGVDPRQPYGYELQPVNFLMKMGIVGCGFWVAFLTWLLHRVWRIYKRAEDPAHRALAKGLLGAMSGMLLASATNPYLSSSPGMGCLLFTVLVIDIVGQRLLPAAAATSHARVLGVGPSGRYRFATGANGRESSLVKGTGTGS